MKANRSKWMIALALTGVVMAGCGDDDTGDVMPGVDLGSPVDMNVGADLGTDLGTDAGGEIDAGGGTDAGGDVDAGAGMDAGTDIDATVPVDMGMPDLGPPPPRCPDISARTFVDVGGDIVGQTWTCNNIYRLTSTTFVTSGTHTIEAGTIVVGAVGNAALVITQSARIDAQGTAELPIRFSSIKEYDGDAATTPAAGDWGGVVLLGRARANYAMGTSTIEGLPATETGGQFGGTDDAHNCGTLQYATIRYAGFIFGTANELNGLTIGACGSATTLDYIEVRDGLDDGIEFFGGSANLKHALVINTGDDSLDWAFGYTGKVQFLIVEQRGAAGEDRGIEADNNPDSRDATPRSAPEVWNATFIGAGAASGGTQDGAQLREGTAGTIRNAIFMSFPDRVIRVQHSATDAQVTAGALSLRNSIFFDNMRTTAFECDTATSTICADLNAEATNRTTDPGVSRGNWQPAAGSAATTGAAAPPAGGFFDAAAYVGAVDPTGMPWYAGWRTAD